MLLAPSSGHSVCTYEWEVGSHSWKLVLGGEGQLEVQHGRQAQGSGKTGALRGAHGAQGCAGHREDQGSFRDAARKHQPHCTGASASC